MSRLSVIEAYVDTRLRTIAGVSVKLMAPGLLGQFPPDNYPGITHGLDKAIVKDRRPYARRYYREREVSGIVLIHGTSDAAEVGDARHNAWTWVDAVEAALDGMRPLSSDMPAESAAETATSVTHIQTGIAESFVSDAGLFGVAVPWTMTYAYETKREND